MLRLTHEPDRPTRQRKKLEDNAIAPWELSVGNLHVFCDVDSEGKKVAIVGIGQMRTTVRNWR